MTFEEWYYKKEFDETDDAFEIAWAAWETAFDEGYKYAHKENEEYDKTLTGDRAV